MTESKESEWEKFFELANKSKIFKGGSEIGKFRKIIGKQISSKMDNEFSGYMKFETNSLDALLELLSHHPVVINGGSVELVDLPKS